MAVQYDSKVIRAFAEALYARARQIVVMSTIAMGVAIGVGGYVMAKTAGHGVAGGCVGLGLGMLIGYQMGQARAFVLRLQAQTALCQVAIEENTRVGAMSGRAGGDDLSRQVANTNAA